MEACVVNSDSSIHDNIESLDMQCCAIVNHNGGNGAVISRGFARMTRWGGESIVQPPLSI